MQTQYEDALDALTYNGTIKIDILVPKGYKSGFVTYRHYVVQQEKLQLVINIVFG